MLDMARVHEAFEASTDFTVGIEEEFAILDPETRSLDHRFEELRQAAQADPVLAESVAGELIKSEIEIRSGRGENFADAVERQRDVRARLFRLAAERDALLARDRDPPLEPLAGAADHRHRALPPRGGGPAVRGLAQQHLQPPRARGRAGRGPRGAGLRPAAAGAARAAGDLGQLALPRRALVRPALGAQPDLHQELPALRDPRRLRELGRLRGLRGVPGRHRLDRGAPRRSGGRSARTTRSAPWSCASATRRPAPRTPPRWPR